MMTENELNLCFSGIRAPDAASMEEAARRFDACAMPLGSLGLLQEELIRIAGILGDPIPDISKRAVIVFCADNGVVARGVTQCGQEVTASVARNLASGRGTVCVMARRIGAEVFPVDIGIAGNIERPESGALGNTPGAPGNIPGGQGLIQRKIAPGTGDISRGPAMTREQALQGIRTGMDLVKEFRENGYRFLLAGEMGIGNTTTSAAVTAALLGLPAETVTGRGAGLSFEGLTRKRQAVADALRVNCPDPADPLDVLSKVGGFDLAGLTGLFLGGAVYRVPVLMDGVITAAAALIAVRLCPVAGEYILASHESGELAGHILLEALGKKPLITAGMRLGEGTGAVAAASLLDLAMEVYRSGIRFEDTEIKAYQHFS